MTRLCVPTPTPARTTPYPLKDGKHKAVSRCRDPLIALALRLSDLLPLQELICALRQLLNQCVQHAKK